MSPQLIRRLPSPGRRPAAWRSAASMLAMLLAGAASVAHADDLIVYSPHVIATQSEIELRGYGYSDGRADIGGERAAELSVVHAFNGWWKPELYLAEYEKEPGAGASWSATNSRTPSSSPSPDVTGPTSACSPPTAIRKAAVRASSRWGR